ncbi:hypothetical protein DYH09_35770 [bacterium CPR1]|nr:hypothetical protein [bacterium CPR1]
MKPGQCHEPDCINHAGDTRLDFCRRCTPPKLTRARRVYACGACGWPIYLGEFYRSVTTTPWDHPDNDGFFRWKFCRFCDESRLVFDVYDGEFNEEFPLTILEFYANLMPAGLGPKPLNRTPDGWWSNWDESILGWMDDLRESRDAAWLAIEEPLVTGLEKMRERIRTRQVVKS